MDFLGFFELRDPGGQMRIMKQKKKKKNGPFVYSGIDIDDDLLLIQRADALDVVVPDVEDVAEQARVWKTQHIHEMALAFSQLEVEFAEIEFGEVDIRRIFIGVVVVIHLDDGEPRHEARAATRGDHRAERIGAEVG